MKQNKTSDDHKTNLLETLFKLQNKLRIINSDLSEILGISTSYFSNMQSKSYVSRFMVDILEAAIIFFKKLSKQNPNFNLGKFRAESRQDYLDRKKELVKKLKKKFNEMLKELDNKQKNL